MIPKYIEQIDAIPITSNGKIDRIALGKLIPTIPDNTIDFVKPENLIKPVKLEININKNENDEEKK